MESVPGAVATGSAIGSSRSSPRHNLIQKPSRDLAALYETTTKVLKQAVRRNIDRFPDGFMFVLNPTEFQNWRSQFVTSNADRIGLRYSPMAFTEHGILMLSSVLNSTRAVQVNIEIRHAFVKLRKMLSSNAVLSRRLDEPHSYRKNRTCDLLNSRRKSNTGL
jgi:L-lactate utilization protein LutC